MGLGQSAPERPSGAPAPEDSRAAPRLRTACELRRPRGSRRLLPMRALLLLFALFLALALSGCALLGPPEEPRTPLPDGWDTISPLAFEELLAREFSPDRPVFFERAGYEVLTDALNRMDQTSVRAALLLAHSGHEVSGRRLIRRLARRIEGPEIGSDAGDVVAAAALPRFAGAAELYRKKLASLARGSRPHPDLEVRVECAASALELGDDASIPFLLQVLRIGTYAGQADERDFTVTPQTAWARGSAAAALARRAGIPCAYQPDGSLADREREAARLAQMLAPAEPAP